MARSAGGGYASLQDLWRRAGVKRATLEKLATADALRSLGLDRRQALWEVRALVPAPALPLFEWSSARDTGEEEEFALPEMALSEHVVNDYQTLRLSLKAHPMSFLREEFSRASPPPLSGRPGGGESQHTPPARPPAPGFHSKAHGSPAPNRNSVLCCEDVRGVKDGARIAVAGVVLVRQRPGSAKGVVFMTIEDETGVANAVVWPKMLEKFRKVVMTSRLIEIRGRVQRHEDIIHIVAENLIDRSGWLLKLSEWANDMKVPLANADEVVRPEPGSARGRAGEENAHPRFARNEPREPRPHHPRNVRIIPKSRDFH